MTTGSCVHKNDALPIIKQKIEQSDLLIIGSPVYEQYISAQTKALFDRTFMWIHLIGLMGKPALTAITTGADGIWLTEKYLSIIMTMMGCIMIGYLRGIGKQPGFFPDREYCKRKYKNLAVKVAKILNGSKKVKPNIINSISFMFMKHHTRRIGADKKADPKYTTYEYKYWLNKGWFKLSYKKALESEKVNRT